MDSFGKVAEYFGEEPKKATPDLVFGVISQFVELFTTSITEIEKNKQEKEKKLKRDEAKAKREKEMSEKRKAKFGTDNVPEGQDNLIAELGNMIEEGQVFKNRRKSARKDIDEEDKHKASTIQNLFQDPESELAQVKKRLKKKEAKNDAMEVVKVAN